MLRRTVLRRLTLIYGTALLSTTGLIQACNVVNKKRTELTENDIPLLEDIADIIIPETRTSPGAKAVGIGIYIISIVNDCYPSINKRIFIEGLDKFEQACQQKYKSSFAELTNVQKNKFLQQLDIAPKNNDSQQPEHYFAMLKKLTIHGYFTSEIGATMALRYDPVPGRFEGCIPYEKGDKPWAAH